MAEDPERHEILSSEQVFGGKIVEVYIDQVRLPDSREARWERVTHPGAVGIVPVLDDETILMVRQYRNAVGGVLLEIPAGKLDKPETPEQCASRELVEEVGHRAGEMIKLAEFYNSPGYSDEYFHLYLARELTPEAGETGPDEFLEVEEVPLSDLLEMISNGSVIDAKSIIGITLSSMFLRGEASRFRGKQ